MKLKHLLKYAAIGLSVAALAGCASSGKKSSNLADSNDPMANGAGGAYGYDGADTSKMSEEQLLAKNKFLFDYDNSEVKQEDYPYLKAHARKLNSNPNAHIRVEGNTDERGSREYNIGLGERRAQAVMRVLEAEGVKKNQISIVSYGKEKPEISGHDETSYQQNRRGVVVYEGA